MSLPFEPVPDQPNQHNWDYLSRQHPWNTQDLRDDAITEAKVATPTWIALPTLQNSWTESATVVPRYTRDALGYVQCEGEITAGTVTASTLLFTFPSGYRPTKRAECMLVGNLNRGAPVFVGSDGTVKLQLALNAGEIVSLTGLRFPTF